MFWVSLTLTSSVPLAKLDTCGIAFATADVGMAWLPDVVTKLPRFWALSDWRRPNCR